MKVWVVMAMINKAPFIKGAYKNRKDAEAKADYVAESYTFFEKEGDEVWVEEWNVE